MEVLSEILDVLVQVLCWGLTLTGMGIMLVGMLHMPAQPSRSLAQVVIGSFMFVFAQVALAAYQGGWRMALLNLIVFGALGAVAILGHAFQTYVVEPAAKTRLSQSQGAFSRRMRNLLEAPRYAAIKRYFFPLDSSDPNDKDN